MLYFCFRTAQQSGHGLDIEPFIIAKTENLAAMFRKSLGKTLNVVIIP